MFFAALVANLVGSACSGGPAQLAQKTSCAGLNPKDSCTASQAAKRTKGTRDPNFFVFPNNTCRAWTLKFGATILKHLVILGGMRWIQSVLYLKTAALD